MNEVSMLLKCQLRWYTTETLNRLIKFKHAVMITIALFVPSIGALYSILTIPFSSILTSNNNQAWLRFIYLTSLQILYGCWICWQKDAVIPWFEAHQRSLPIKEKTWNLSIIVRLLVANNLLLLPIILSYFKINSTLNHCTLTSMIGLTLIVIYIFITQLSLLFKRFSWLLIIMVCDVFLTLSFSNIFDTIPSDYFLLGCFIPLVSLLLPNKLNCFRVLTNKMLFLVSNCYAHLLKININFIFLKKYRLQFLIRLGLSTLLIVFFTKITKENHQYLNFYILIYISTICLVASGLFPLLKKSRDDLKLIIQSLPITEMQWYLRDYLVVVNIVTIQTLLYFIINKMMYLLSSSLIFYILTSIFCICAILCYIQNKLPRTSTIYSVIAISLWLTLLFKAGVL